MAMIRERTATPWWTSLLMAIGLLLYFVGERFAEASLHDFLTGAGLGLLVAGTGIRAFATLKTSGARRRVERTLLVCHVGTLLAIAVYLGTKWHTFEEGSRAPGILLVLVGLLLVASIVPALLIELSLGVALRTTFDFARTDEDDVEVEFRRVREMALSGLSIAFALGFLMVTCKVATERNIQRDVSYFKTSSPGTSTKNIIEASSEPIRVLLFFPPVNEVKTHVRNYFESIDSSKLKIEEHDRAQDAALSTKYKVAKDGVIVLVRGEGETEKSQPIEVDTDIDKARKASGKLRNLDKEVNSALVKLARDKRKAYLVSGHGEVTNPESMTPEVKARMSSRKTTLFKKVLGDAGYETKDLGLMDLSKDVPDDATIVILLAPTTPLLEGEWDALGRYLDRGGHLMIAMDPLSIGTLGPLEGKLGVKYNPNHLTDDVKYYVQRGTLPERRLTVTNQFSSHASTTGLSRTIDKGLLMIDSGVLEDAPFAPGGGEAPKKTYTVRSLDTSFLDFNDNFLFDASGLKPEKKQRYNLAAAIEGPKKNGADGFRAIVFADVDWFVDLQPATMPIPVLISGPMLLDAVRWLGGEEVFAGETVSEDDTPIKHTKGQDAVWFVAIIIGMPLLVATLGIVGTTIRRRRRAKKAEVKS